MILNFCAKRETSQSFLNEKNYRQFTRVIGAMFIWATVIIRLTVIILTMVKSRLLLTVKGDLSYHIDK